MKIGSIHPASVSPTAKPQAAPPRTLHADKADGHEPLKEAFQDFVGQTLFGQMLASMRATQGEPAYMNGGRAEEVFREQLDAVLVERISAASAGSISEPMYQQFLRGKERS